MTTREVAFGMVVIDGEAGIGQEDYGQPVRLPAIESPASPVAMRQVGQAAVEGAETSPPVAIDVISDRISRGFPSAFTAELIGADPVAAALQAEVKKIHAAAQERTTAARPA
jgi:hypothetical protein